MAAERAAAFQLEEVALGLKGRGHWALQRRLGGCGRGDTGRPAAWGGLGLGRGTRWGIWAGWVLGALTTWAVRVHILLMWTRSDQVTVKQNGSFSLCWEIN